ncbi:BspA family leucine-rich repeat surface protein [Candidatus Saccharibacteria bacterium]|nr:BspA family leucine-rich repeat surface protein [Candidatus Saccharibacteria bacterium]
MFSACSAALLLFGALILAAPVDVNTNATDDPDITDGLSLITSPTVEATINPEEGGALNIVKDTLVGTTNSPYGYEVYISTSSDTINDIYLNGNPQNSATNQKIAATSGTYSTPAVLDITNGATWGYAIAGLDNFDASYSETNPADTSKFAAVPTVDSKQLIHSYSTATANDPIDVYFGFNVDTSLLPGSYKVDVIYTIVPITPPPRTVKAVLGDNGNLNFLYDRRTYNVGDTYTDNLGSTTIKAVYNVPTNVTNVNDRPQWTNPSLGYSSPTSANFDQSFYNFKPTSTAYWFYYVNNLASITNIDKLNTSDVTNMSYMFFYAGYSATAWNIGNLNSWNVSSVTDMSYMFCYAGYSATTWNIGNLNSWNVSSVTDMSYMFSYAGYKATTWGIGDLGSWDVGSVTNMSHMFAKAGYKATTFDLGNLDSWNVSDVTDMSSMFDSAGYSATTWSIGNLGYIDTNHPGWDVSGVTDMSSMFDSAGYSATTWNIGDISSWNVGSVTNMSSMFSSAGYSATAWNIGNLGYVDADHPGWNVGSVTNMSGMFKNAGYSATTWNIGDISSWNVGSVTNMSQMFYCAGCNATTWNIGNLGYVDADHSGWDVSNVTQMSRMFFYAGYSATTWDIGDIGSWNVGSVTNMSNMFYDAGYSATTWNIGNVSNWNVSSVTDHSNFISTNANSTNLSVVNNQPNWP